MLGTCERVLSSAGYQCIASADPHEAMHWLESEHPDLLLMDLRLPEIDGMEMLRHMRQLDPRIP